MSKIKISTRVKDHHQDQPAYNHRDVMPLKPLVSLTSQDEKTELQHNRILQPGFLDRSVNDFFEDAKKTKILWLTDYACPAPETSLFLNIAKEIVVNYRISEDFLNQKSQEAFLLISELRPSLVESLTHSVDEELVLLLGEKDIRQEAVAFLENRPLAKKEDGTYSEDLIESASRLILDQYKKKIINKVFGKFVKDLLPEIENKLGLVKKPEHIIGYNSDYCLLGAAASGKTTIARNFLTEDDRLNSAIIATDIYRGFVLPGTEKFETIFTQDVLT